jgi:transposase
MRFYTEQHQNYCGIDLHARKMYTCIINKDGEKVFHRNLDSSPEAFLKAIEPYQDGLVVGAECMFAWYWLADLCTEHDIPFILGHALYMKAIHGAKTKHDRIDAEKIARLLKGGNMPMAYVYPQKMRATRDLLRRRLRLVRQRAEHSAHVHMTADQYNLEPIAIRLDRKNTRKEVAQHFPEGSIRKNIEIDLAMIDLYDQKIKDLESYILKTTKIHDPTTFHLLKSINGVGDILAMTLFYEIGTIERFSRNQTFLSYCRLVPAHHSSMGKNTGGKGKKMGNAHLKWAFSEAVSLMIRHQESVSKMVQRLTNKYGKARAMSRVSQKLGRTVYYMMSKKELFDIERFLR